MEITTQEKLMYEVMKSIYDSGMPISFKGSMVLKACLIEAGYTEDIRHTFDIDANWYSDKVPFEDVYQSVSKYIKPLLPREQ